MKRKKKQKLRETIVQYCKEYEEYIYLNERIEGKLQQIPLSKVSEEKKTEFISKCIDKRIFPIRLKTQEELDKGSE